MILGQAIWNMLGGLGCDVAQGYYLSRPLPAPGLEDWLSASLWSVA
jgi:EAL domain-containing protein (putative c-di-GMP-specific phosphodiesterase class I)